MNVNSTLARHRARLRLMLQDPDRARRLILERLLGTPPLRTPPAEFGWMDVSDKACGIEAVDWQAALDLHRAIARLEPTNAHAQYRLGRLLRYYHRDVALCHLEAAIRLDPAFGPFWSTYIDVALEELSVDDALRSYDALPAPVGDAERDARRALLLHLFRVGNGDEAMRRCGDLFGPRCRYVVERPDGPGKYSMRVEFHRGHYGLVYGPTFLGWPFLVDRLLSLNGYLTKFSNEHSGIGAVQITVGDAPEGSGVQLCFSGNMPDHRLIPDPMFLASRAYEAFRLKTAAEAPPWDLREPKLYWRGSLTGQAETFEEIFNLPRVRLVDLAKRDERIDAKITDLSQFGPLLPELQIRCNERGLLGPKEDETRNAHFKYLIDIDGNTNSWPGLWTKLSSGSPVIKLKSAYRQWYYDRLVHGVNVWEIGSLEEGVPDALDRMEGNPDLACVLAQGGRALTSAMTPRTEYPVFREETRRALG